MEANEYWSKIKELLSKKDETFAWLCSQADLPVQVMRNRINKGRIPSTEDTIKLLDVLNVSIEEFYGVGTTRKLPEISLETKNGVSIPVFNQVFSAGFGQFIPDMDSVEDYITVPHELDKPMYKGHLAAVKVRGDSMEPTLSNGDTIICDDLGYDEDGIYIIHYKGKGFVKRLQQLVDGVKIISDNPAYEPMIEKGQSEELFNVIGKVHYVLHKL